MEDYTRLWVRLVWFVHSCPMRIFKWTPDFHPNKESPLTPIWVHFHGLSLYLFEGESLLSFANSTGKPLRIDSHNVNRVKLEMASLCVELDVSKPLMKETLEDCKRDLEKEQGKAQKAPYVNRRRPYRRVVNPAKSEIQKGRVIDENNKTIVPQITSRNVASSVGTKKGAEVRTIPTQTPYINRGLQNDIGEEHGLDGIVCGAEVDKNDPTYDGLASGVEGDSIPLYQGQRKAADVWLAEDNNILIDTKRVDDNVKVPSHEGLMVIQKDFQEPMGVVGIEFTSQSAPSSPKYMARAEESLREGTEKSGRNLEECHISLEPRVGMSPQSYRTSTICLSNEAVVGEKLPAIGIIEKACESLSNVE
ncbi:hypothetical protein LIER_19015 [Lithospermum erythrorhizon]|uniref:DUF4283 domain-containing protein n=1 Tax=Lithospermum erythrorhizon TaxID=34254 RepID=A0AAV3QG93_LITER